MTRPLDFLRRLLHRSPRTGLAATQALPDATRPEHAFDLRLQKLGGIRHVSVSRAVLFRTQPGRQEA